VTRTTQIGITGGIGSGKSLISKIFNTLGIPVYDADSRAKNLMTTDGILISLIKKEFGALSYHKDGSLNRSYISQQVFLEKEKLNLLNTLVHPRVEEDYKRWVVEHQHCPYVLKEAALLFEAGSFQSLDRNIVVYAPEGLRMKRVLMRDKHRTETQVRNIIVNQMPDEEKLARADFIIKNDETELVIPQVLTLHKQFSH
jgi:dephospho-CoA kinase